MNQREPDHWLVRPETIRWIWRISIVILAMTVLLQPNQGTGVPKRCATLGVQFAFLARTLGAME